MRKLFQSYFSFLKLKKNIPFKGKFDDLQGLFQQLCHNNNTYNEFDCQQLSGNTYKITSHNSAGTLRGNVGPITIYRAAIYLHIQLHSQSNEIQEIRCETSIRVEHYFMLLVFGILFLSLNLIPSKPFWTYFIVLGMWILFHFVFHFVYRFQEKALVEALKMGLIRTMRSKSLFQ